MFLNTIVTLKGLVHKLAPKLSFPVKYLKELILSLLYHIHDIENAHVNFLYKKGGSQNVPTMKICFCNIFSTEAKNATVILLFHEQPLFKFKYTLKT